MGCDTIPKDKSLQLLWYASSFANELVLLSDDFKGKS